MLLRRLFHQAVCRPRSLATSFIRTRVFAGFIGALVYLVSPVDLVPEAYFGLLGLVDDVALVAVLLIVLCGMYRRHLAGVGR